MRKIIWTGFLLATLAAPSAQALEVEVLPPSLVVSINKSTQKMHIKVNGKPAYTFTVSTGARGYGTPSGSFVPTRVHRYWWSRQWDNAPMHWAVFFHNGYAIHGTDYIRTLGIPASHGCVRLHPRNAATFFALVNRYGRARTRITLHGTPNFGPVAARSSRVANYRRRSIGSCASFSS